MKKLLILFTFIFFTTISSGIANQRYYHHTQTETHISIRDSVYHILKGMNVKYPEVGTAQAMLETGNFKSRLFKQRNNLFGIRKRYVHNGHAVVRYVKYASLNESCEDYVAYYKRRIEPNIKSREDYLRLLKHYSATKNYVTLIRHIVSRTSFDKV